jgi:hypothetical protein
MTNMKISNKKKWLKVTEFAVVGVATCLNPHAGFLLFLLKLCFQILTALQKDDSSETDKDKRITPCLRDRQQFDRETAMVRRSLADNSVKSTKQ